ncbi:class E sortase [Streptomyces fragilis]|uniref:class E sortase n=1 Tax=Streptomyces fragilis TaxID=67301 RepID=UPI000D590768|nr:class E sortase [Streptomyces fragilis]
MARSRPASAASAVLAGVAAASLTVGCATGAAGDRRDARPPAPAVAATALATASASPAGAEQARAARSPAEHPPTRPDPHTREARLSIPALGLDDLRVVRYEGTTDDRPGTRIQDRGHAASPYGPDGGVGPGEIGNHLVTAHRLSAGGPLRDLPSLDVGDRVLVTSGGTVHEYRITETRTTSFRSGRSLAEQRAEVPGHPGREATRAMITVSTCATPEDDAAGNFWRDGNGNPEHRIDKIGVLVSSRPA